jgi:integrase
MKTEPRDTELKPLGECTFTKAHYKDQWKVDIHWKDPSKSADPRKQRCKHRVDNPRAARQYAEKVNAKLALSKGGTNFTFNHVVDAWLKSCERRARAKEPDLSLQTVNNYRRAIEPARAKLGPMLAHQIKTKHIRRWAEEQAHRYKKRTILGQLSMINKALNYAQREDMLGEGRVNPLKIDPMSMRMKDSGPVSVPDRSNMQRLRDYLMGPRPYMHGRLTWSVLRVATALAATCSLRASESCGLCWDQIDGDTGEITVVRRVVRGPLEVREGTKSPAGIRKIPTNLEMRQILNEHMAIYVENFGKPVGHVLRTGKSEFMSPGVLSGYFANMMKEAGIVDQKGKPKFSYHGLRHWFAAFWIKHTNIYEAKTWTGHKQASTILDLYGFYIDDEEGRAKFESVPDWLAQPNADGTLDRIAPSGNDQIVVGRPALPAAAAVKPAEIEEDDGWPRAPVYAERWLHTFLSEIRRLGNIDDALLMVGKSRKEVRYELSRCAMPTTDELQAMVVALGASDGEVVAEPVAIVAPAEPCPLEIPGLAAAWIDPYIRARAEGMTHQAACQRIRKNVEVVKAELRRVKMPSPAEIARRLRKKRIAELLRQGYQDTDIARMVGLKDRGTITPVRNELRIRSESKAKLDAKLLETKGKIVAPQGMGPTGSRKNQPKLL